jgi:hypothetical protein
MMPTNRSLSIIWCKIMGNKSRIFWLSTNDHEESFITPENERYCAGGSGTRSIKFLEI